MKQRYQIAVEQEHGTQILMEGAEQETLLETFLRNGLFYRADCGGRGTCGKCKIKVTEGELVITAQDAAVFSPSELKEGYRLACKAIPSSDVSVTLCNRTEEAMKAVSVNKIRQQETKDPDETAGYIIAIDLGTTTMVFRLSDVRSKNSLSTYTMVNPQRIYGADVISRIKASVDGKRVQLQQMIRDALLQGILEVMTKAGVAATDVLRIAIAGNTTMQHLLMGYSCETLGVYPFTPINLKTLNLALEDLFPEEKELTNLKEIPVLLLPGISAFVGSDIVAGLAVCGFHASDSINLLIDLGTNGEVALGSKDRILVTSTAAGPAFEGGNISCGVGSIPGAISRITLSEGSVSYETIDDKVPVGICGTGVIELVSELLRTELMDDTGLLCEKYFQEGYPILYQGKAGITFLQKDIRELQLAKAAVRAGIEILLKRYGITYDQVDQVYLAGGFGFYLDVEKAIRIGLLPIEFREKIVTIGNSSLAGAELVAGKVKDIFYLEELISKSQELHLSMDPDFNELYLEYMSF